MNDPDDLSPFDFRVSRRNWKTTSFLVCFVVRQIFCLSY